MSDEPKDEAGPSPRSEFVESVTVGPKQAIQPGTPQTKLADVIDYEAAARMIDQLDEQRTEELSELAKLINEQAETPEEVKALLRSYLENFKWLYDARTAPFLYVEEGCFITWEIEQGEHGGLTVDNAGLFWVWLLDQAGVLEPAGFQVDIS